MEAAHELADYVLEMGYTHVAVSYTHLDVYKRQSLHCADALRNDTIIKSSLI